MGTFFNFFVLLSSVTAVVKPPISCMSMDLIGPVVVTPSLRDLAIRDSLVMFDERSLLSGYFRVLEVALYLLVSY